MDDPKRDEHDSPVVTEGMASMPWSEFETLTRKAAAFDSLMATFDALQGFRDDKTKKV
jgi:hypothetical protein